MGNEIMYLKDGLFDEEIFYDMDSALKERDSIKLCAKIRSNMEIILKNILVSHKVVKLAERGDNNISPRRIARGIWNKKLWRLLNDVYAINIINHEEYGSLNKIKDKCDGIIHTAFVAVLTEDGQKSMHSQATILFTHLLKVNKELGEWKINKKK